MKREILYRAKMAGTDQWVKGGFTFDAIGTPRITEKDGSGLKFHRVIPETVGQFTGLTDKNGIKVFEGDIVRHEFFQFGLPSSIVEIKEVYFDTELLQFGLKESSALFNCQFSDEFEVIGTIHDNSELR